MKTFLSPLTMEQESECLKKMKNGDLEARNELIERNMRLVAHVAKKYQNPEDEMEDLISIGSIGLIKAVETYKEDYGSRLATYAARCIDNELLMHFRAKRKRRKKFPCMSRLELIKRVTRSSFWMLWSARTRMLWNCWNRIAKSDG